MNETKTETTNFERQNQSPSLMAGMFGGRFGQSMPDTTRPLTDRDQQKRLLKEEISKCMQRLEVDENNNPNNITSATIRSEVHAPVAFGSAIYDDLSHSATEHYAQEVSDVNTTSMSNLLLKYH